MSFAISPYPLVPVPTCPLATPRLPLPLIGGHFPAFPLAGGRGYPNLRLTFPTHGHGQQTFFGHHQRRWRRTSSPGRGQPGRCLGQNREGSPPLLLPPEAPGRRQLPHVPGRTGLADARPRYERAGDGERPAEDRLAAQAGHRLRHQRHPGPARPPRIARRQGLPRRRDGDAPPQPPARLPDLRPGRRVQAPGILRRIRPRLFALCRREERQAEEDPPRAPRHARRRTLHPLLALRALLQRDRQGPRPGLRQPRFLQHADLLPGPRTR